MARHSIVPATIEHIDHIANNIRDADKNELWASCLQLPRQVLSSGLRMSEESMTGMVDGEPVCVWGVVREGIILDMGTPWMVASKALDTNVIKFLRHCKPEVVKLLGKYDILENYVDVRNTRSVQWLKWLGFTIEDPEPYGALKMPFHRFWMKKEIEYV